MARVGGTDKNSGKLIERSTYVSLTVMERKVVEQQAYTQPAASLPSAPRNLELLAARKSDLPLSRFPLRGKAGAGGFPPRRWHAVCQQKALAPIDAAAPPARGVSKRSAETPLAHPPMDTVGDAPRSSTSIEWEKKLRMAATSALTFTTFS